jgi:hypothetical protein
LRKAEAQVKTQPEFHSEDESWLRPNSWKQQVESINRGSFNAS